MAKTYTAVIIFWVAVFYRQVDASNTNFKVTRFDMCNSTQGLIKFSGNITHENGNQYLSCNMESPFDLDDKLGVRCLMETKTIGNNFLELFTIREKHLCKAVHTYLGEFFYDIERAAQLPPGVCPILKGRYHVHHMKLDFAKVKLQTFPFGKLRFTVRAIDNKNPETDMLCLVLEVENYSSSK